MKKRIVGTLFLIAVCAAAVAMALKSYDGVNNKLELAHKTQNTMQLEQEKVTPTPEATPTPIPEATPTPTPEPVNPELPVLTFVSEEVEIKTGSKFDVVAQVADITDNKDDRYRLFRNIQVHGDYNTNVPGEYSLEYIVTDSDGNQSIPKILKLIVKA